MLELNKQLSSVSSEHKKDFLDSGVSSILKLKPSLEKFKEYMLELNKQLSSVSSEYKKDFLNSGVKSILESKPSLEDFKQDISIYNYIYKKRINLELFNSIYHSEYINYTKNRLKNYKKFKELINSINIKDKWSVDPKIDVFSAHKLTVGDTDKNFNFKIDNTRFVEFYNFYKDKNLAPILKTNNLKITLPLRQKSELKLTTPLNNKVINKYTNMISLDKRNQVKRLETIYQLVNPEAYNRFIKNPKFIPILEKLNNQEVIGKIDVAIRTLVKKENYSLIKPVIEQSLPFILENRNVNLTKNLYSLENKYSFINNLLEFFTNDLKEFIKDNINITASEKEKVSEYLEGVKIKNGVKIKVENDLKQEYKKFKVIGGTQNEDLEFQTSKTVLDALCGQTGETCISTNYNIDLLLDKHFQPITIVNKKTGKADGSIYAYITNYHDEKILATVGIEPKIRLVNNSKSKEELTDKLINSIKEIAKQNGINRVFVCSESGKISNRNDLTKIITNKYFKDENKRILNFEFPKGQTNSQFYEI